MATFAEKVIQFNRELFFGGNLPNNIQVMNPFKEKNIASINQLFYNKLQYKLKLKEKYIKEYLSKLN